MRPYVVTVAFPGKHCSNLVNLIRLIVCITLPIVEVRRV